MLHSFPFQESDTPIEDQTIPANTEPARATVSTQPMAFEEIALTHIKKGCSAKN